MNKKKIKLIKRILNIWEMGSETIRYSDIYIYNDGPGNRRQITVAVGITEYGNLKTFISRYVAANGKYSKDFAPYVEKIGKTALVDNSTFINLLKKAGREDTVYQRIMEEVYDDKYIKPALKFFNDNKFTKPLSLLVIADSYLHSGGILNFLRNRFREVPPVKGGTEAGWITAYLNTRRNWLATHSNKILRNTVYRCDFMLDRVRSGDWELSRDEYSVHGKKLKNL